MEKDVVVVVILLLLRGVIVPPRNPRVPFFEVCQGLE